MASTSLNTVESPSDLSSHDQISSAHSSDDQYRKLFIGGLSYTTTDEKLREYCAKFGEITECVIMRDREGRSRGFAFVSFQDRAMLDHFMASRPHTIDGRQTESKRAMPREEASKPEGQLTVKKIFIGGIKEDLTEEDLKAHFQQFGNIIECNIMKDKDEKLRGFAFITFDDYDAVDRCILEKPHRIHGKELDVRKAIPREQIPRFNPYFAHPSTVPTDFYSAAHYPSHLMIHPPPPSPPVFPSPFVYLPPNNPFSKPMPLMASNSPCSTPGAILPSPPIFFPADLVQNNFIRPQTYPSPPSPLLRTNQNGHRKNDSTSLATEFSQLNLSNGIPPIVSDQVKPPVRNKLRSTSSNVSEQNRKLFIGGLSFKTTDESLKEYVTKFGEVSDSLVMKDQNGQSRCFGFVTFVEPQMLDEFMKKRPHTLDGRQIDPKRAMPREEANNEDVHLTVKKIFIGGIRDGLDETMLKEHFSQFGQVVDCFLMHDKDGKTRGFAFLEFDDFDAVDKVILARPHVIGEHRVDVKKAVPKDQRQQQQQQQFALQMQAAACHYYYNHPSFNPMYNSNGTMSLSSAAVPPSLMRSNGHGAVPLDNGYSHIQTSNNSNPLYHLTNPLRSISTSNNRRQSSRGSQ